jgi:hypothetical protein
MKDAYAIACGLEQAQADAGTAAHCDVQGSVTVVRILPKQVHRDLRPAALLAIIGVVVGASLTDSAHVAAAQGRLDAEYTATLAGIPIGRGKWTIDISDDGFTAAASGATIGLLRFFATGRGVGSTRGIVSHGQPVPASYASTITNGHRIDDVHILFAGGNVRDFHVEPALGPDPNRIPVRDADRRNVVDPITSTMAFVGGTGDPLSPQACPHRVPVFDGRMRFDLYSEFKRMDVVKAEKGYQGPVVVCAVYFAPIAGYLPDRLAIRYLASLRDAEAWVAPIAGTRVLVPFRFSLPTPVGTGVIQATQFLTVAKEPRAAANMRMQ